MLAGLALRNIGSPNVAGGLAVAELNELDTASQWGHEWLAQATPSPGDPCIALCELPASRVPSGGYFSEFQSHPLVTQYFLDRNLRCANPRAGIKHAGRIIRKLQKVSYPVGFTTI